MLDHALELDAAKLQHVVHECAERLTRAGVVIEPHADAGITEAVEQTPQAVAQVGWTAQEELQSSSGVDDDALRANVAHGALDEVDELVSGNVAAAEAEHVHEAAGDQALQLQAERFGASDEAVRSLLEEEDQARTVLVPAVGDEL